MMHLTDNRFLSFPRRFDVLVVDDEPIIVRRLSTLLSGLGYSVTSCTDGERALEIIRQEKFFLIITDLKMRKVDGIHLLREARRRDSGIKVIIMTGFGNGDSLSRIICRGLTELIHKPFKMDELQRAIASVSLLPEAVHGCCPQPLL